MKKLVPSFLPKHGDIRINSSTGVGLCSLPAQDPNNPQVVEDQAASQADRKLERLQSHHAVPTGEECRVSEIQWPCDRGPVVSSPSTMQTFGVPLSKDHVYARGPVL